jgi:thiamine-monophosphate kinase
LPQAKSSELKVPGKVLREIGEFGLINRIRKWMISSDPALVQRIGDDVAVIEMRSKPLPVSNNILTKDAHFDRSWTDPYSMGTRALPYHLWDNTANGTN